MTAEQGIPPGFLERATREAVRYGDDPWILLRELVQNSRDAGATRIAFVAGTKDGFDVLACTDDGRGMTRADMRAYLLRLYASGKAPPRGQSSEERARGPVGRFGVGFWSVLRFSPALVRVESYANGEATAFEVDCVRRVLREVPCALSERGTRVTLWRRTTGRRFVEEADDRLSHWAGPVRGLDGQEPPTLTFNGVVKNAPLAAPELIAERLRGRGFDGVIGFGRRPSVLLYAHGLLLKEAGSLEELLPRRHTRAERGAAGLYPVVHVNADGLEVLMNRREVVEDELLERIVATCERRLRRLRRKLLDRLAPLRVLDRLRVAAPRFVLPLAVVGLLGAAGATGAFVARFVTKGDEPRVALLPVAEATRAPLRSTTDLELLGGPRINQPSSMTSDGGWDLRLQAPEGLHLLRLRTLSRYDEREGLVEDPPVMDGEPSWGDDREGAVMLDIGLPMTRATRPSTGPSLVRLAVPSGHGIVRGSLLVDDVPARVLGGADGEPLLLLEGGEQRARYTTGPTHGRAPRPSLLDAPPHWPSDTARVLARAHALPLSERVTLLERFVKERVRYTTALDDAARFHDADGPYVERVLSLGLGDCDVMNALFALLLRAAGIPAHVAVGLVASGEQIAPDLHAWTEYHLDGAWHSLDVSPPLPVASGGLPAELLHAHGHTHGHTHGQTHGDAPEGAPASLRASAPPPASLDGLPPEIVDALAAEASGRAEAASAPTGLVEPGLSTLSSSERSARLPWGLALLGGLALALVVTTSLRRLTRRPTHEDDEALAALLAHWLRGARECDPLHLRFRPFFAALGRRRRFSLAELDRKAARGLLFAALPEDPLVPSLRRKALVLDASRPSSAELLPLLPEVVRLDMLSRALAEPPRDPLLDDIEAALRRVDEGVRVLSLRGATGVNEIELPAKRPLAPRYLLVGEDDPAWRALRGADAPDAPGATKRDAALRFLLERTTLYREQRRALLAALGAEGSAP